ncbi:hypothetical protein PPERSA_03747 [Pseudocohnilembus persalinus]|uniref:Amino acid transporter transmembrane domain-containing protein n=1 Tax=Pseudocohnilembus persalinus TaxID=266149 RepID=A0A0V0QHE7_PSEPJ|nr:hypothetical protein PPERSA_03747 [Pseudocohnilembus persalinus]|eukprot:KRX01663.1 hypothetical protein PPERSA_03747 [Pseudocohnilembus persalinus]
MQKFENENTTKKIEISLEQHTDHISALSVYINVMLGIGPIIIPAVFKEAGILLSLITTVVIIMVSYVTNQFVIEAMSICNALNKHSIYQQENLDKYNNDDDNKNNKNNDNNYNNDNEKQENLEIKNKTFNSQKAIAISDIQTADSYKKSQNKKIIQEIQSPEAADNNISICENNKEIVITDSINSQRGGLNVLKLSDKNLQKQQSFVKQNNPMLNLDIQSEYSNQKFLFNLTNKYEYGEMGSVILGNSGNVFITLIITIYLIGILIAKCISTGKIMADSFHTTPVLNIYEFWLFLFFFISALFSFRNVQSTKKLQKFIVFIRIITILTMTLGCIYHFTLVSDIQPLSSQKYPYVNYSGFGSFFSNTVLAFALHHSIPSMLTPVRPEKKIKNVYQSAFAISFGVFTIMPILAVLAFGDDLVSETGLKFFNYDFQQSEPLVFYISSFYMFLNITAFPVLTITTRNNLMKLIVPMQVPEQSHEITRYTLLFTILIVTPIFLIAYSVQNIQIVLDLIGGIFGVILITLIPSLLIIKGRKQLKQKNIDNSLNMHKTPNTLVYLPLIIFMLSLLFLALNFQIILKKNMIKSEVID